jgi:hypothetical protein
MFVDDKSVHDYISSHDGCCELSKLYYLAKNYDSVLRRVAGFERFICQIDAFLEECKRTSLNEIKNLPDPLDYLVLEETEFL